jgi:16S rRNA (guanine966-N2)-methyltransferase
VILSDASSYLEKTSASAFDLIFLDPPYEKTKASLDLHPHLPRLRHALAPEGLVIWEHYNAQTFTQPHGWTITRHRIYGETGLTFLQLLP